MLKKFATSQVLYTVGIAFIIINSLLIYQKSVNRRLVSDFETELKKESLENSVLTDMIFKNMRSVQLHFLMKILPLEGTEQRLHRNLFVWRYFDNYCNTCIEEEFININKYSALIGSENIVILGSVKNMLELNMALLTRNLEDVKHFDMPDSVFNFAGDGYKNRPFYFVLDSNGYANMIFYPDPRIPDLTGKYFDIVTNKYFGSLLR